MSLSGVASASNAVSGANGKASSGGAKEADDAFYQELKNYFFESPAERILDNWLAAHKISKAEYNAMTPEQKEAISKEIAEEIKKKTEQRAEAKANQNIQALF